MAKKKFKTADKLGFNWAVFDFVYSVCIWGWKIWGNWLSWLRLAVLVHDLPICVTTKMKNAVSQLNNASSFPSSRWRRQTSGVNFTKQMFLRLVQKVQCSYKCTTEALFVIQSSYFKMVANTTFWWNWHLDHVFVTKS